MTISMQQTKNDRSVEDLSIDQRKCFFNDEVELKHIRNEPYTYPGCLRDCKINLALDFCGCLPPFHIPFNDSLTLCEIQDLKCLKDERITDLSRCKKCELSCDFITFTVENIITEYVLSNCWIQFYSPIYLIFNSLSKNSSNLTQINIAMKHWPLLTFHREVRFGFIDFLVAFGSIMTLFLSFSLLSAIEVLLYTLRFIAWKICPKPT